MTLLLIALIMFFALLTLSLTGFGHALVAMPLLTPLVGIEVAAPLVAIVSLTGELIMLVRYRRQINIGSVWRLSLAALVGIPLGIMLARALDERIVLVALGVLAAGYGAYALLNLRLPELRNRNWAFPFGFVAGLLSGAYNTGGPPVVIYGSLSRWPAEAFKSSVQGMFVINSVFIVSLHFLTGHVTTPVMEGYVVALPMLVLGLIVGFRLEPRLNPVLFRRLVLVLLVLVGLRLIAVNLLG